MSFSDFSDCFLRILRSLLVGASIGIILYTLFVLVPACSSSSRPAVRDSSPAPNVSTLPAPPLKATPHVPTASVARPTLRSRPFPISPLNDKVRDPGLMLLPDGRHVSHNPAILPLKIWVDRSARKWGTAVERAAAIWNSLVKEELFQFVGTSTTTRSPDTGEVVIFGLVSQAESQADTHFYVDRETGYYTLTFITVPILTEAYLESITIIMHELGHVLGLDHDPQLPDSLMHPVIKTPLLLPTDSDLEVIKSTYFPARNPQEK